MPDSRDSRAGNARVRRRHLQASRSDYFSGAQSGADGTFVTEHSCARDRSEGQSPLCLEDGQLEVRTCVSTVQIHMCACPSLLVLRALGAAAARVLRRDWGRGARDEVCLFFSVSTSFLNTWVLVLVLTHLRWTSRARRCARSSPSLWGRGTLRVSL